MEEIRGRKAVAALVAAGVLALVGCSAPSGTSAGAQNKQQGQSATTSTTGRSGAAKQASARLGKEVHRLWTGRNPGTRPMSLDDQFWRGCFAQSENKADANGSIAFSVAADGSWWRMSWQKPSEKTAKSVLSACADSLGMPRGIRGSVLDAGSGWQEARWTNRHSAAEAGSDGGSASGVKADRYRVIYGHNPDDWNNVIIERL